MDSTLFKAILAMDSYNRGYNQGIILPPEATSSIGNAILFRESDVLAGSDGVTAGFYGIAYSYNGATVISYRGTDEEIAWGNPNIDLWNGYGVGFGSPEGKQAELAFKFYNNVAQQLYGASVDPHASTVKISLTGHSLGGGLAGLVGAVYGKSGLLFDNMAFEAAALHTEDYTRNPGDARYNADLKQLVYGNLTPWAKSFAGLKTVYVEGDFLEANRWLQATPKEKLSLGDTVDLVEGSDGIAAHSMATLVMRLYADKTASIGTDWKAAAPYFWPVMYDDSFAAGFGNYSTTPGAVLAKQEYSGIVRTVIAYSAIDEGTRVFGDTGIRALYDDANDLGKVLLNPAVSQTIVTHAADISKAFVQFAGTLALNKILQSDNTTATQGVLSLDPAGSALTVNFSDTLWKSANAGAMPNMPARADLVGNLLTETGDSNVIRIAMGQMWGDSTTNVIDRVIFSTAGYGYMPLPVTTSATDQATLFVGGTGNNVVVGSASRDLILGGAGNDEVTGSPGNDIIHGGTGIDTVYYTSYSTSIKATKQPDGSVSVEAIDRDTGYTVGRNLLSSVEKLYGSAYGDRFYTTQFDFSLIDGGDGYDTLSFSKKFGLGVTIDYRNNTVYDADGTRLPVQNIEWFSGSEMDDIIIMAPGGTYDAAGGYDKYVYMGGNVTIHDDNQGYIVNGTNDLIQVISTTIQDFYNVCTLSNGSTIRIGPTIYSDVNLRTSIYLYGTSETTSVNHPVEQDYYDGILHSRFVLTGNNDLCYGTSAGDDLTFTQGPNPEDYFKAWSGVDHFYGGGGFDLIRPSNFWQGQGQSRHFHAEGDGAVMVSGYGGQRNDDYYYISDNNGYHYINDDGGRDTIIFETNVVASDLVFSIKKWSDVSSTFPRERFSSYFDLQEDDLFMSISLPGMEDWIAIGGSHGFSFGRSLNDIEVFKFSDGSALTIEDITINIEDRGTYPSEFAPYKSSEILSIPRAYWSTSFNVHGYDGDDTISLKYGDDVLDGGDGNDVLAGGGGNDKYYASTGTDSIFDSDGYDEIIFSHAYNPGSMSYLRSGPGHLIINDGTGSTIQVSYQFSEDTPGVRTYVVELMRFSDGTIIDLLSINPQITGGAGADRLEGDAGNNVFVIQGPDTIADMGGTDTVTWAADVQLSALLFTRLQDPETSSYTNLQIIDSSGNSLFIENHFRLDAIGNRPQAIESLQLSNGGTVNLLTIPAAIVGTAGDDSFVLNQTDVAPDDMVQGNAGNDTIYTYSGNDTLDGGAGNDTLDGGTGNDTFVYSAGADRVYDSAGTDILKISSAFTPAQAVYNRYGNDLEIAFGAGNTVRVVNHYLSGKAVETLSFANGTNVDLVNVAVTATGTAASDALTCGAGNDIVYGLEGTDTIRGNDGNDALYGGTGNDTVYGGNGDDTINGEAGSDTLYGDAGNDTFIYDGGADKVNDSAGTDILRIAPAFTASQAVYNRYGSDLEINFGTGNSVRIVGHYNTGKAVETLNFATGAPVNLLTVGVNVNGTAAADTALNGGVGNDTIKGLDGDDTLRGNDGNDTMYGGNGIDTLYGGNGDDALNGDAGNDILQGDAGNDLLKGLAGDDNLKGNDGNDTLYGGTENDTISGGNGDDSIYGDAGVDTLNGDAGKDILYGLAGNDNLIGGTENDTLYGGTENDTLSGGNNDDILYGEAGNDTLNGDSGNDTFVYSTGLDVLNDTGGLDTLKITGGKTINDITVIDDGTTGAKIVFTSGVNEVTINNLRGTAAQKIETITFDDGFFADLPSYKAWIAGTSAANTLNGGTTNDTLIGKGGNDTMNGNAGNDALHGGTGDDIVHGNDGNDTLHGGDGIDALYGDAGDDWLCGWKGLDTMSGGLGSDRFVFRAGAVAEIDTITDFKKTENDRLDLSDVVDFNPLTHAITDFVQITTSGANSILKIDADGTANGVNFVQIATLQNVTGLTDEAALVTGGYLLAA